MFEVFSNTTQTLATSEPISFSITKFEDCRIALSNNGQSITVKTPGKYLVHFDAVGNSTVVDSPITIQLYVDGTAQPCGLTTTTTSTAEGPGALSFDVLITVKPSCCCSEGAQTLQFINTATDTGTITHANVVIIHL